MAWQPLIMASGVITQTEGLYRIAAGALVFVTMLVVIPFRLRAAASGEKISRRPEGYLFAALLRFAGLTLWLAMVAYLISPASVVWASMPFPPTVRWGGLTIGLLAIGLMYWTLSSLGRNLTDTVVTRKNATLVTQGPYRWVRHPYYGATGLLMVGMTLLSANGLLGIAAGVVLLLLALRTGNEERQLIERFGNDYRRYMVETGRFFPRC